AKMTTIAINRERLPSIEYWRVCEARKARRVYISFCLLTSSIQDALLGCKERDASNLNWSSTCSFYSLVHTGRLLCFLALGDFPTRHQGLRNLLSTTASTDFKNQRDDGFPFDWLRKFTRDLQTMPAGPPRATTNRGSEEIR